MHELIYTFESFSVKTLLLLFLVPLSVIAVVLLVFINRLKAKHGRMLSDGTSTRKWLDNQYMKLVIATAIVAMVSVIVTPMVGGMLGLKETKSVTLNVSPLDSNSTKVYKNVYELIQGENTLVCAADLFCLTFPKGSDPQTIIEKVAHNGSNNPQLVGEGVKP